jgi:Surface antigen
MVFKKLIAVALIGGTLAGCASDPYAGGGNKATLGTLAGAVAGGAVGSRFGQGSGKVAAIAGGALLGGFLGNHIGAQLDANDRAYYQNAQYQSLESGQASNWQNPQSGRYGSVAVGPTQQINNSICREYTNTIYIDGQPQVSRGTACRNPDGTWRPVS